MTPEAWSIIATGIVVLIAIATSNRSLRAEISQLRTGMEKLSERMNRIEIELRERLARVEGILDAIRDSVIRGRPAPPNPQRQNAGSQ